jgi:hypothetical protein
LNWSKPLKTSSSFLQLCFFPLCPETSLPRVECCGKQSCRFRESLPCDNIIQLISLNSNIGRCMGRCNSMGRFKGRCNSMSRCKGRCNSMGRCKGRCNSMGRCKGRCNSMGR